LVVHAVHGPGQIRALRGDDGWAALVFSLAIGMGLCHVKPPWA
jgi:hypothetical protein